MAATAATCSRTRPAARVCAAWLFGYATASAVPPASTGPIEVESLKMEFDSEWAMRTSPGYLPVRLDITNLGGRASSNLRP